MVDLPVREQRERDHAHRLLGVVLTVGVGDVGSGKELREPEAAVAGARRHPLEDPVDDEQEEECGEERGRRRDERRDRDLVHEAVPLDALRSGLGERRADEAAEEGM